MVYSKQIYSDSSFLKKLKGLPIVRSSPFIYLCPVKFSFELSNEIIGLILNNVEKLKEFEDIYKVAYLFI